MRYTLIAIPSYGENGNKEGKVLVATDNEDDEVQKGDKGFKMKPRLEIFVPILAKFRVPVSPVLFFEILRGHIAGPPRAKIGQAYPHVRENWY